MLHTHALPHCRHDRTTTTTTTTLSKQVFLDLRQGDKDLGRVEIVLYAGFVPKTAENFRALCTGEKGVGKVGGAYCTHVDTRAESVFER
jgi:hypothetical protein